MTICSFLDCEKKVKACGLCTGHYGQNHSGQELTPLRKTAKRGELLQWIKWLVDQPRSQDCIDWPFGSTLDCPAYSQIRKRPSHVAIGEGQTAKPTTIILELLGFPRPSDSHSALHSCDNPLCVNPNHIRWGTAKENAGDMYERGRHSSQRYQKLLAWLDEHGIEFPEEMR